MLSRTRWLLDQLWRKIWVRASLIGSLAVLAALLGTIAGPLIPEDWAERLGAGSVDQILDILASSMLAVVIFSLSVAVQAFGTATANATPRANALLAEDQTTQNVLSIFLGAFLFGLAGIIALTVEAYGNGGRLILFFATLAVITLVVGALIHWIQHVMRYGRMSDILDRVEMAATQALEARARAPFLGGSQARPEPPEDGVPVAASRIGYVQFIDVPGLAECAEELDRAIHVVCLPGSFVHPAQNLLHLEPGPPLEKEAVSRLRKAFSIGDSRTFDQDPRFGVIVLSEVAIRALSPAVNDPGTAIDVISRLVRVIACWSATAEEAERNARVFIPGIDPGDLLDDAFRPIARDGAGMFEVQIRLQKALAAIAMLAPDTMASPARRLSRDAIAINTPNLDAVSEMRDLLAAAPL